MQYTEDSIWRKEIRIKQPENGYRFALDAVLLGHFVKTEPSEKLLEMGAGVGVVTILVAAQNAYHSVAAVEIQNELAQLCRKNFQINNVPNATVYESDIMNLSSLFPEKRFDLIYTNPPYRKIGSGKLNRSIQKAVARHEIKMNLQNIFECALQFLKPSGRLSIILPEFRESDFCILIKHHHLQRHEWKYVHSFAAEPPALFLATIGKNPVPFVQHPPLIIYDKPGQYTDEMNRLLSADP